MKSPIKYKIKIKTYEINNLSGGILFKIRIIKNKEKITKSIILLFLNINKIDLINEIKNKIKLFCYNKMTQRKDCNLKLLMGNQSTILVKLFLLNRQNKS